MQIKLDTTGNLTMSSEVSGVAKKRKARRDEAKTSLDDGCDEEVSKDKDNGEDGGALPAPSKKKGKKGRRPLQCNTTLQGKWDEMFDRLVGFRRENGHCLVPNRYSEDPQLGSWVSTQRRQYKILTSGGSESTPMTPERASRLMSIGFEWATKDPRHVPWETRYEELLRFVEKYGHAQVPIGWEDNVQLSNWVSTQRQEYKLLRKGRSSRLTNERLKLLNKIGFVWEAQRGGPRRRRSNNSSDESSEVEDDHRMSAGRDSMARDAAEVVASMAATQQLASMGAPQTKETKEPRKQLQRLPPSLTGVRPGMPGILPPMAERAPAIHQVSAFESLMAAQQQEQLARNFAAGGTSPFSAMELHAALAAGRASQQLRHTQDAYALGLLGLQQPGWHPNIGLSAFPGGGMEALSAAGSRLPSLEMMAQLQRHGLGLGGADHFGSSDLPSEHAIRLAAARHGLYGFADLNHSGRDMGGGLAPDIVESRAERAAARAHQSINESESSSSLRSRRALAASESLRALTAASGGLGAQLHGLRGAWRTEPSRNGFPPHLNAVTKLEMMSNNQSPRNGEEDADEDQTKPGATDEEARKRGH